MYMYIIVLDDKVMRLRLLAIDHILFLILYVFASIEVFLADMLHGETGLWL